MSEYNHSHETSSKNLVWSVGINIVIVVFEIILGLISRSFALIADALHNVTDVGSMILSLWGEKLMKKPQTNRKTYGYKRAEVLIAFVNGGVLFVIVGFILIEAIIRIFTPEPVSGITMMIVASVALFGNGLATYLLKKGADKNLNLKSAWLHSLQDALFSFGVVISAAVIYFTGWSWLDSLVSIIISIFLLKEIFNILFDAVDMLMDSVPKDIDFAKVKSELLAIPGVVEVNDLHIWQTGSENKLLSSHLKTIELNPVERMELIVNIQSFLEKDYHINHTTLQIVSESEAKNLKLKCSHCN